WIRRDRDLAVAAFYLQPAFDDRELPFRKRAVSGLSEPDVHANALVVARVVEVDADPHERFAGADLEAGLRVHGFVVPDVTAVEHGNAPERPVLERLEMLLDWFFNQHVPLGRRVVVAVADVLPTHDAGQVCDIQPRLERRGPRDCPWDLYRPDARPAERRNRDCGDHGPLRPCG